MERTLDNPKLRFGHFLELFGPGWEARAQRLGLSTEYRAQVEKDFRGKLLPIRTPRATVVDVLGLPDDESVSYLKYDLGVRSGYLFVFSLWADDQLVQDSEYIRSTATTRDYSLPTSRSEAEVLRAQFCQEGVTAAELRAWFGEPEDRIGWWPYETWTYPGGLRLELRLGVVEG